MKVSIIYLALVLYSFNGESKIAHSYTYTPYAYDCRSKVQDIKESLRVQYKGQEFEIEYGTCLSVIKSKGL